MFIKSGAEDPCVLRLMGQGGVVELANLGSYCGANAFPEKVTTEMGPCIPRWRCLVPTYTLLRPSPSFVLLNRSTWFN